MAAGRVTPVDRLRETCLALPETTERASHGEPAPLIAELDGI